MRELLAVVVGSLVGTALRFGLDMAIPHTDVGFPFSTLLINIVGSFALGVMVARVWAIVPAWTKAGLGPGLLGTFTTFSAFAVSLVTLTAGGQIGLAVVYLVASLGGGFLAAFAGLRLGRRSREVPK